MALGASYATLAELKARLGIDPPDTTHDVELDDKLSGASREVEDHCHRQFNDAGTASARIFYPVTSELVELDDCHTVTVLVTDEGDTGSFTTVWSASDYQLEPLNGVVDGQPGWPCSDIRAVAGKRFRCGRRASVNITAIWGWETVPAPVKDATLILASESFKLREAPFGVAGFGDFGVVRIRDIPVVARKLAKYVRNPVLVG